MSKLRVFFVSNVVIKVKILENDRAKPITHPAHFSRQEDVSRHRCLKKMFPVIDVDNL